VKRTKVAVFLAVVLVALAGCGGAGTGGTTTTPGETTTAGIDGLKARTCIPV
jgi:hypothetical protein